MHNVDLTTVNPICLRHSEALFKRTLVSLNLLQVFWQRDDMFRHEEYQNLQRTLDSWYFGFGSPAVPGLLENVADDTGGATLDTSLHPLIWEQIPDLIRIRETAPIEDIRSAAAEILKDLKIRKKIFIPHVSIQSPSFLLTLDEVPQMNYLKIEHDILECDSSYTTCMLFREYWFRWGRLENYIYPMAFHPEYLESYMKTHDHLFHADLPIPYSDRFYLALLAAAQQRCIYLCLLFARQFLATGGDSSWLQGIKYGPVKWRQLANFTCTVVNQPWAINSEQIYNMTHGGGCGDSTTSEILSLSELMHAVSIFTHVHALTVFVFGCAIRPDIDQLSPECGKVDPTTKPEDGSADSLERYPCCQQKLASVREAASGHSNSSFQPQRTRGESSQTPPRAEPDHILTTRLLGVMEQERLLLDVQAGIDVATAQFEVVTQCNSELDIHRSKAAETRASELLTGLDSHPVIARFVDRPNNGYVQFEGYPFHESEYCWDEEGSILADRLCPGLGNLLNEKFRNTYYLTYNNLSAIPDVDTTIYRRAVWNHTQSLFGVCHDDFHYECMEKLLNPKQRSYLKLCAILPVAVNPAEHRFGDLFPELSISEVIHIILMVSEARQQACLLYVLRAISSFQARGY